MLKNRLWTLVKLAVIPLMLSMTGCENGNLARGIHKSGQSGDIKSLTADASLAFRNRDYAAALALYQEVLNQNPNDADALYGAAAAQLGVSGLNLGVLISNILVQQGSAGASSLGGVIAASRESVVSGQTLDANSILAGINLTRLKQELPTIRLRIEKILKGETNLARLPDDIDVNVNAAIVFLLDAVVVANEAGILDVTNENDDYAIVQGPNFNTACSDTATIRRIGSDLIVAYRCMNRVVGWLGLNNNQIITRCREDIKDVLDKVLDPASPDKLPAGCLSTLSSIGITYGSYGSYSDYLY